MILKNNLQIYGCIGTGGFSNVFECNYKNKDYVYKQYVSSDSIELIKEKMFKLRNYKDTSILFPVDFVYLNKTNKLFEGILFDYNFNYYNMDYYECQYFHEKIMLLNAARDIIEYYHKEYKMIHADINPGNILYNETTNTAKLIDLDTSIDMTDKTGYLKNMSSFLTNKYIKYFGINYELDLYLFNLLAIAFLNNLEFYNIEKIINEKRSFFDNNHINNIINDYKNIGCQKSLKKEYIIDYI